jgi:hypothetical protein
MREDRVNDCIGIGIDFCIPEAQNPKAECRQRGIPRAILFNVRVGAVLAAVDLDDESCSQAREVDDKRSDRWS